MVGLPHRPHRVVGVVADTVGALAAPGEQDPHPGPEVGPGQDDVEDQAGEHEHEREGLQHVFSPDRGQRGHRAGLQRRRASRRRIQATAPASADVGDQQRCVADRDPARTGYRIGGRHHPVDDPWLAPDLGRHPARDQGDGGQRPGRHHAPVKPGDCGKPPAADPHHQVDQPQQGEQSADPDHGLKGEPDDVDRRTLARRDAWPGP